MHISYKWKKETSEMNNGYIEERLSALILQDCVFCHTGIILVNLAIDDPLDSYLKGEVNCSCGKKVCSFEGDSQIKTISFNKDGDIA